MRQGSQPAGHLPARLSPLSLGPHGDSATVTSTELGRRLLPLVQGQVVEKKDRAILKEAKGRKMGKKQRCWLWVFCAGWYVHVGGAAGSLSIGWGCPLCMCMYACVCVCTCVHVRVHACDHDGEREGREQLAGLGEAWLPLKGPTHSSAPGNLAPLLVLEMMIQSFQG